MSNQIVKPLEWVEHGDNGYEWHRATPPIGERYNIEDDGFSAKKLTVTVGQLVLGNFDSLDEGKAAAQADYEQRILSALSFDLPSLQEIAEKDARIAELREALLRMEHACEQLAATRTHEIYTAMIDGGQTPELLELDNARRAARAALSNTETNANG